MPSTSKSNDSKSSSGRNTLVFLGIILLVIQLLILYLLSRHTTVLDVTNTAIRQEEYSKQSIKSKNRQNPTASASLRRASPIKDKRKSDGTFNGINIYYTPSSDTTMHSTVSCVGENYQDNAYMYRSCHFTHLCFDTNKKDYVLFQSAEEREWLSVVNKDATIGTSSIMSNMTVALGGLNPKWRKQNYRKLEWFPEILPQMKDEGYYELPSNYVWVPFHSFAGFNAGHIIWDDFLPIYTLLKMFGLLEEADFQPLLTRYVLKDDPLWATCDLRDENKEKCSALFQKFLPAMNINPSSFSTTEDFSFQPSGKAKSKYVCAKHGAAGLAMLTDHGIKAHGWEPTDYKSTHNMGRGPMLYAFRNYMLSSLDSIPIQPLTSQQAPYHVVFSKFSSQSGKRRAGFEKQLDSVQKEFSSDEVVATAKVMKDLSLHEQVTMASQAAIWVTSCGGGAVTAMLLPRGASVIIYYDPKGSIVRNRLTNTPARLDWDLFNHMSYLRVHWLPSTTMNTPEGLQVLNQLIRSELHVIKVHQALALEAR